VIQRGGLNTQWIVPFPWSSLGNSGRTSGTGNSMLTLNSSHWTGPLAAGARGKTVSRSSGVIDWRIVDLQQGRAVFDFPAPGANAAFVWTFSESEVGTKGPRHRCAS
jgi:hypothetical protein